MSGGMNGKKLYIETLGCAMNVRDSEHMIAELRDALDYSSTEHPEEADLILINTCSVRERPVHKLFSELGAFKKRKKEGAKIGVCGCSASHLGEEIIKRAPYVSFVLGARNVSRIRDVVEKEGAVEVDINHDESTYMFANFDANPLKAMINISIGCDKSCAYCIVPKTRGEEISIPLDMIVTQAEKAAMRGAKEVLLLGQNVNSYGRRFSNAHQKVDFVDLLRAVSEVAGIERIRFASPHPLHMDKRFIDEFVQNEKICNSIHMPLQSGSTEVLKRMRRGYSKEWFLERALEIRERCKGVSIGTDIIVGFPGESERDFEDSMELLERVKFEQLFSFKFSPRPMTEALEFTDRVDDATASARLQRLQARHAEILGGLRRQDVGRRLNVLVERIEDGVAEGRSGCNRSVRFGAEGVKVGACVDVKIEEAARFYLYGSAVGCTGA